MLTPLNSFPEDHFYRGGRRSQVLASLLEQGPLWDNEAALDLQATLKSVLSAWSADLAGQVTLLQHLRAQAHWRINS